MTRVLRRNEEPAFLTQELSTIVLSWRYSTKVQETDVALAYLCEQPLKQQYYVVDNGSGLFAENRLTEIIMRQTELPRRGTWERRAIICIKYILLCCCK